MSVHLRHGPYAVRCPTFSHGFQGQDKIKSLLLMRRMLYAGPAEQRGIVRPGFCLPVSISPRIAEICVIILLHEKMIVTDMHG